MQFVCNNNKLRDLKALANVVVWWPGLWRLELTGNPLTQRAKYRDRVIVMNDSLGTHQEPEELARTSSTTHQL